MPLQGDASSVTGHLDLQDARDGCQRSLCGPRLIVNAGDAAGRPEQAQDGGHVTPSKASAKASSQQSASAAEAAKEEVASVRREATAAKEASAAELSLMRRQLASAQSAAADAEAALAEAEKVLLQPEPTLKLAHRPRGASIYSVLCVSYFAPLGATDG